MKFTYSWLKEFLDLDVSAEKVAELLTQSGTEVESLKPLDGEKDWVFEIAVGANRGDCLGVLGVAREIAALTGGKIRLPPSAPAAQASEPVIEIQIKDKKLCPRYSARVVHGLAIAASPTWLSARLEACDIRSINSVVDVTNLVMLETGQPLHAFDLDKLRAGKIVVRPVKKNQKFFTLDGVERELVPEDLLICDGDEPVALAGVMGGMNSEVTGETKNILLESAHFDPVSVRRTSKRMGLRSEASYRFERWVDPEGTVRALDRAIYLLEHMGGQASPGLTDSHPGKAKPRTVRLRHKRLAAVLGFEIEPTTAEDILSRLGLKILSRSKSALAVEAPSFRIDLHREADLIEEIVRIHGYDKVPITLPAVRSRSGLDTRLQWERKVRSYWISEGLTQIITLSFASGEMNRHFPGLWQTGRGAVTLLNPLNQENTELRRSLLSGLVDNARQHRALRAKNHSVFELGKVFHVKADGNPEERQNLSALIFGERPRLGLKRPEQNFGFLDLKGLVEGLLELCGLEQRVKFTQDRLPAYLHPGMAASLVCGEDSLGVVGALHPEVSELFELPRAFVMELDFDILLQYASSVFTVQPLPRFPSIERDMALVLDNTFPAHQIVSWIKALRQSWIEDIRVTDEYRGSPIPEGKKSLSYSLSYRAEDRTLTDGEVNELHQTLVKQVTERFGAQLRA